MNSDVMLNNRKLTQKEFRLSLSATLLAFVVVVLGAVTRLTDAGLGCPDWPGCYGQMIPSNAAANPLMQATKAWTEMTHRYVAGLLSLLIFCLSILAIRNRRDSRQPVVLPLILVGLVVFQAILGMWTVTLKLFPLVVMAHLMGGLSTLALLWWLTLKLKPISFPNLKIDQLKILKIGAGLSLLTLILQLMLGGWTSANYAALVCIDFPFCQQKWFSMLHLKQAFNFNAGIPGSIGQPLDHIAKVTIHMTHRIGAVITTVIIAWLAFLVFVRTQNLRFRILSVVIAVLLTIQILLGITNVLALLPLSIAIAHNAIAALLLLSLVTLNYYLNEYK